MTELSTRASEDFGNILRLQPRAVIAPGSADALADAVLLARREGYDVVARGRGHCVFGQCQSRDGLVVDMSQLRDVVVGEDSAIVGAGASWRDVLRVTLARGLAPPVLTDYIGLSVGGTLSVGGIGAGSFRFGAQTDQIRSLTLVTGAGEILQCSPTRAPELFDAARAGLGQVGVITSVELSLIEVPPRVRHYRIPYPTIAALLADLDRLVDQAEFGQLSAVGLVGADGRWSFHIDAVVGFEIGHEPDDAAWLSSVSVNPAEVAVTDASYLEYSCRLDPVIEDWRASGLWQAPHPWVDVFVPGAALSKFAQAVVASLEPEDLGTEGGMILIYPIANTRTPLLPVDTRGGPAYLFDVLRCNPGADAARVEALLRHNREIFEEAVALGGSLYTISAVNMSPEDWRRQFGGQWDVLLATKRRHDPDGVMGSGYCALEG